MKKQIVVLAASAGLAASALLAAPAATAAPSDWDMVLDQDAPKIVDSIVIDGVVIERSYEAVLRDHKGRKIGKLYGGVRDHVAEDHPSVDVRYRVLVFEFADGQVIAEGVSKYKMVGPYLKPGKPTVISITGGTGAYVGVRGELKTVNLGDGLHRQMLKFVD